MGLDPLRPQDRRGQGALGRAGGRARGGLGSVRRDVVGPRRLARTLAARPQHPSTSGTREIRAHAGSTHRTPRAVPRGSAGPAPGVPNSRTAPGTHSHRTGRRPERLRCGDPHEALRPERRGRAPTPRTPHRR
ncbi:hypothetical protein CH313_03515 [Streptomyces sp. TSRI0384-2]|nr:hypothetical protein CH313_03515 [Streptomyces sp. TSRI0384-2]